MNVGELIAPYLGLRPGDKPLIDSVRSSTNNVTSFRLKIPTNEKEYTVHVVREDAETSGSLEDTASVAGFYNAKYFYEMSKFEKLEMDVGYYEQTLKIEDEGKVYPVFVTDRYDGLSKDVFEHEQLFQVAEQLSKLHAFCLPEMDVDSKKTLDSNFEIVDAFRAEKFRAELPEQLALLCNDFARFFANPSRIADSVHALFTSPEDLSYVQSLPEVFRQPSVLCHGDLSADKIFFNERGKISEIREWDNVHYGSVAEDLSYLIITSASTDIRRNKYMSVFRRYFYHLVDMRALKFKLADLKECYKRMHKFAALFSMGQLVSLLQSEASDEQKASRAERWETTLEDAIAIETGEYPSDNEDAFFSN